MSTQPSYIKLQIGNDVINVPTTEIPKLLETLKNVEQGIEQDKKADHPELLVRDLNWTNEEIAEAYARMQSFQDDWDAPGMELYDNL